MASVTLTFQMPSWRQVWWHQPSSRMMWVFRRENCCVSFTKCPCEVCNLHQHLSIPWAPTRLLLPKGQPTGIRVHSPSPPVTHCWSHHLQERAQPCSISQPCLWLMQSLWLLDSSSNKFYLVGDTEIKNISFIGPHFHLFALVSLILCLAHWLCCICSVFFPLFSDVVLPQTRQSIYIFMDHWKF